MNKLPIAKRAQILHLLCEGSSMRATARIADCSLNTVARLMIETGKACSAYQDEHVRGVKAARVQLDEIWSFCFAKQKNVAPDKQGQLGYGDLWTWTAVDADSKLMISWLVGARDGEYAKAFVGDLAGRVTGRIQVTSDGHAAYPDAVDLAFGGEVDFAQLIKVYGNAPQAETRYSPAECVGTRRHAVSGNPDPRHISTSYVERANLSIRMGNRRFTRLTNAHSKKLANHIYMFGLWTMFYNYARINSAHRVSPAMQAGLSDHVWSMDEIAALVKDEAPKTRGPYKKRKAA